MFRVVASIVFVIVVIVAFFVGNRETSTTTDTPEVQSQPLPATPGKNFNF